MANDKELNEGIKEIVKLVRWWWSNLGKPFLKICFVILISFGKAITIDFTRNFRQNLKKNKP
jgi:hypothetical protein